MSPRTFVATLALWITATACQAQQQPKQFVGPLNMDVPHVGTDNSVKYDFPIVYVRAPRRSPDGKSRWAEVGDPRTM